MSEAPDAPEPQEPVAPGTAAPASGVSKEKAREGCGSKVPCKARQLNKPSYIWRPAPEPPRPTYEPCPHLYFRKLAAERSAQNPADKNKDKSHGCIATQNAEERPPENTRTRRTGPNGEVYIRYKRKKATKRTIEIAKPKLMYVKANWESYKTLLPPSMTNRLHKLIEEIDIQPEKAPRVKRKLRKRKCRKEKEPEEPHDAEPRPSTLDEREAWVRCLILQIADQAIDEHQDTNKKRVQELAVGLLDRLADAAGFKAPSDTTEYVASLMLKVAGQVAGWIDSAVTSAEEAQAMQTRLCPPMRLTDDPPCTVYGDMQPVPSDPCASPSCAPPCPPLRRKCVKKKAKKRCKTVEAPSSCCPQSQPSCCPHAPQPCPEVKPQPVCMCACYCAEMAAKRRKKKKGLKGKKGGKGTGGKGTGGTDGEDGGADGGAGGGEGGDAGGGEGGDANVGAVGGEEGGEGTAAKEGDEGGEQGVGEEVGGEGEGGDEQPDEQTPEDKSPGSKSPGTKSPGSKSPGSKSPGTKSPAKSPGSKSPTKSPGSQSPAKSAGSKSPAKSPGSKSPAKSHGSKSPEKSPGSKLPAKSAGSKSPAKSPGSKSPAKSPGAKSPQKSPQKSPAKSPSQKSPAKSAGGKSPGSSSAPEVNEKPSEEPSGGEGGEESEVEGGDEGEGGKPETPSQELDESASEKADALMKEVIEAAKEEVEEKARKEAEEKAKNDVTFGTIIEQLSQMIEETPDGSETERRTKLTKTLEKKFTNLIENESNAAIEPDTKETVAAVSDKIANWMERVMSEADSRLAVIGAQPKSPLTSNTTREWAEWIVGAMFVADDWAAWIKRTVTEAERKAAKKKGAVKTDDGEVDRLTRREYVEWKEGLKKEAIDFRMKKKKIGEEAVAWRKKTHGQKTKHSKPSASQDKVADIAEVEEKVTDMQDKS